LSASLGVSCTDGGKGGQRTVRRHSPSRFRRTAIPSRTAGRVIDVKGDWWGIWSSADVSGPALSFVIFGGEHADVPLEPTDGELLADLIVDDRLPGGADSTLLTFTDGRRVEAASPNPHRRLTPGWVLSPCRQAWRW
jgi:hypothetical protein